MNDWPDIPDITEFSDKVYSYFNTQVNKQVTVVSGIQDLFLINKSLNGHVSRRYQLSQDTSGRRFATELALFCEETWRWAF